MIPKIICFIFGHKLYYERFKREVRDGTIWETVKADMCTKCGAEL